MSSYLVSAASGGVLAVLVGWLGYILGVRQARGREERERNQTAAKELTQPLRDLQRLLRRHGLENVETDEVTAAFSDWSRAFDDHGHRLPQTWHHISHSVRDAAGTVFGGVALVHVRPDTSELPLGPPDVMWQQYADDYLHYAATCTLEWGDSSPAAPKRLLRYENWLVQTERRAPYGQN